MKRLTKLLAAVPLVRRQIAQIPGSSDLRRFQPALQYLRLCH